MQKRFLLGLAAFITGIMLVGCGGGGGGSNQNTGEITRTLVGFVYVKNPSVIDSQPEVIITSSAIPPNANYDVPSGGQISLIASNGKFHAIGLTSTKYFSKSLGTSVSQGNEIIITVTSEAPYEVSVSGSNITSGGTARTLTQYTELLNTGGNTLTTKNMQSVGAPTAAAAGTPSSMRFTLNGVRPPATLVSGQRAYLAAAYMDADGNSVNGLPINSPKFSITSSNPAVGVDAASNMLLPSYSGVYPGTITISGILSDPSVTDSFDLNFDAGTATTLKIYDDKDKEALSAIEMRWKVATDPQASATPSTLLLTAKVFNAKGAAMSGVTVNWTNVKAPNNVWATSAGGSCFLDPDTETPTTSFVTDDNGEATVMVSVPNDADGDLQGIPADPGSLASGSGDSRPKFMNYLYATVQDTNIKSFARINIMRQINALKIYEKQTSLQQYVDIKGRYTYSAYGVDVDKDQAPNPTYVSWSVLNTTGSKSVGDPGDTMLQSTSTSVMDGSTLVTGNIAGEAKITLYGTPGKELENLAPDTYTVQIYGVPVKIQFGNGPSAPNADRPWEYAKLPHEIVPYTNPPSELSASLEGEPNGDNPPKIVAYLYVGCMDSFGHYLPGFAGAGWYEVAASRQDNPATASLELNTSVSGMAGEPCVVCTFVGQGYDRGSFVLTGTYTGIHGGLSEAATVTRMIRISGS